MAKKRRVKTQDVLLKKFGVPVILAANAVAEFVRKLREVVEWMDSDRPSDALEMLRSLPPPEEDFALWDDLNERHPIGRLTIWQLLLAGDGLVAINSFRKSETFLGFIRSLPTWKQAIVEVTRLLEESRLVEARKLLVSRLFPDYANGTRCFKMSKKESVEPWEGQQRRMPDFDMGLPIREWSWEFSPSRRWVVLYVLYEGTLPRGEPFRWMCLTLFAVRSKGWVPVRHDLLSDFGSFGVNDQGEILIEIGDNAGFQWSLTRPDWTRFSGRFCGRPFKIEPVQTREFRLKGWIEFRALLDSAGPRWEFLGLDRDMEFRKNTINDPYFHVPAGMNREMTQKFMSHLEAVREEAQKARRDKPDSKVMRYWSDYASEALALLADLGDTQAFDAALLLPRAYQRRESYYSS